MVEVVLERALDQPLRLGRGQALLGLALELRIADEQRQDRAPRRWHASSAVICAARRLPASSP